MELINNINALKLFNEKSHKLEMSSFVSAIQSPDAGISIKGNRNVNGDFVIHSELRGPSDESVESFTISP